MVPAHLLPVSVNWNHTGVGVDRRAALNR